MSGEKRYIIFNKQFKHLSHRCGIDINTVAVASGSCSEIIPLAFEKGADVIITGDMKYHNMIDMTELGICVIDAGHLSY